MGKRWPPRCGWGTGPGRRTPWDCCRGDRDPALADTEGLDFSMSAELLLLIERLTAADI
jgi:hypothetical protein